MNRKIRIGTRNSMLAKIQTELAIHYIKRFFYDWEFEIHYIQTSGDKITDRPLYDIGGKALFTKELDSAIINNEIDIAIHSAKDIEANYNKNSLIFPCVLPREDKRDVFISKNYLNELSDFQNLSQNSVIGTSSLRREYQLHFTKNDLRFTPIRGNINTRINKLINGELGVDGIVLAMAGLKRANLFHKNMQILDSDIILPAVCQGIIAIQCHAKNTSLINLLSQISHQETMTQFLVERHFVETINGSCTTAIGTNIEIIDDKIHGQFIIYRNKEHFLKISDIGNINQYIEFAEKNGNILLDFLHSS